MRERERERERARQTDRQTETKSETEAQRERERERERDIMNWVTCNYPIFSHCSLRNVSRKLKILNRMWCYHCFYLH